MEEEAWLVNSNAHYPLKVQAERVAGGESAPRTKQKLMHRGPGTMQDITVLHCMYLTVLKLTPLHIKVTEGINSSSRLSSSRFPFLGPTLTVPSPDPESGSLMPDNPGPCRPCKAGKCHHCPTCHIAQCSDLTLDTPVSTHHEPGCYGTMVIAW